MFFPINSWAGQISLRTLTAKFMMELTSLLITINLSWGMPFAKTGVPGNWLTGSCSFGLVRRSLLQVEAASECCVSTGRQVLVWCGTGAVAEWLWRSEPIADLISSTLLVSLSNCLTFFWRNNHSSGGRLKGEDSPNIWRATCWTGCNWKFHWRVTSSSGRRWERRQLHCLTLCSG